MRELIFEGFANFNRVYQIQPFFNFNFFLTHFLFLLLRFISTPLKHPNVFRGYRKETLAGLVSQLKKVNSFAEI